MEGVHGVQISVWLSSSSTLHSAVFYGKRLRI